MTDQSSRNALLRRLLVVIALTSLTTLTTLGAGCKTPDRPHFPIPDQSLSIPIPDGLTRIVFLNTNYQSEGAGSGPIRIQLDGQQVPSVWPERYVQIFVVPGDYDLLIEQSNVFFFKQRDRITIEGGRLLIAVFKPFLAVYPVYEILAELPSDFESAFRPARHPKSW